MEGERLMTEYQWMERETKRNNSIAEYFQKEHRRKEKLKSDIKDILSDPEIREIIKDTFR